MPIYGNAWRERKRRALSATPRFGVFNDEVTTFKMSWAFTSIREGFRIYTFQRCYYPGHPHRNIGNLEIWQRAIDLEGLDPSHINLAIDYNKNLQEMNVSLGGIIYLLVSECGGKYLIRKIGKVHQEKMYQAFCSIIISCGLGILAHMRSIKNILDSIHWRRKE